MELQLNCREIILNNQLNTRLEQSLITTDRLKKPVHHNKAGRECGGGARGLAGLPCMAAEVPEGYSVAGGFPLRSVGSKPQGEFPGL